MGMKKGVCCKGCVSYDGVLCRYNAPVAVRDKFGDWVGVFPKVRGDEWCGKFEGKGELGEEILVGRIDVEGGNVEE